LKYVFDACALIAVLKKEKGADKINSLLEEAIIGQSEIFMSSINLIEVHYGLLRTLEKEKANTVLENIYELPINFINTIDEVIFHESARLKAQYAIPLGDSIGLATAIRFGSVFVTSDHDDFEEIEKAENISFFWFR